ncbi:unnamed protein product [Prunus armeniaca]|uniref:Uncharacterized protein n=1 Tax=Prunus armeniaca TaxID=36596 RepID=A0A6J5WBX9_PRUAR|nr:unnamed protein product [Prunus armeniaca]
MADLSKKFDSNSQRSQISCSIFLGPTLIVWFFCSVYGAVGVKGKSLHYLLMLIEPSGFGEDENFPSPDGVEFHTRRFKFLSTLPALQDYLV